MQSCLQDDYEVLRVYWPESDEWYEGYIRSNTSNKLKHVVYGDQFEEFLPFDDDPTYIIMPLFEAMTVLDTSVLNYMSFYL